MEGGSSTRMAPSRLRDLGSTAAFVAALLFARSSLADHYHVPSGSMEPTVEPGDHVLVNKLAYGLRLPLSHTYLLDRQGPQRGDVVVLDSPENDTVLLKRVVATPGDLVEIRDGQLRLDGKLAPISIEGDRTLESLDARRHPVRLDDGGGPDYGPTRLPPGRYLLVGDNRGNSHDGRSFGLVERSRILGRAFVLYRSGAGLQGL